MTRVAAGLLIVGAVIAMGTVFPQAGFAAEPAPQPLRIERPADVREVVETRGGSHILALLVTLEALRGSGPATTSKH